MEHNFEGRKILVTGSGRGIGRGIVSSLALAGAKVYALDCVKETLDDLAKEIPAITTIYQDLKDWEQTKEKISQIDDLDGLVNCAGVVTFAAATDVQKDQLDLILDVNLKAAINLMQVFRKKVIVNDRGGSIVNISSVGGTVAVKNVMPYCVAKAGLNMARKMFALEFGPHKVRVNSVSLTSVNTEMSRSASHLFSEEYLSKIPMGCINEIEDVVHCVLFLLSDQSEMVTGTVVMVDGGHTCYLPV